MHHHEGFKYATALVISMGYYTIRLYLTSYDMIKIVTDLGKLTFNCLPMCTCTPGDIFQAKVGKLIGDI